MASGIADRIFGGPNPKTIATASLESMRAQNRLTVFAARYVSVVTSEQQRLGGLVSSQRTLILPGDVRYELDLSKLQQRRRDLGRLGAHADGASCRSSRSPDPTSISTRSRNMAAAACCRR